MARTQTNSISDRSGNLGRNQEQFSSGQMNEHGEIQKNHTLCLYFFILLITVSGIKHTLNKSACPAVLSVRLSSCKGLIGVSDPPQPPSFPQRHKVPFKCV